ncbi:MAG: SRPBCC family protein [Myxococcota bacterium]|nr:SRPBCC family protein [Myxococcota bacterium]
MITTALTARVEAAREGVWRAITDPAEIVRWDEAALALLEPSEGWPGEGSALVWRYQLGAVSVKLRDRPTEIVEEKRLRSAVELGSFRFEQIWSIASDESDAGRTRLGLSIAAKSSVPLLGAELDRFDVRRVAAEYVDGKLRGLRSWFQRC